MTTKLTSEEKDFLEMFENNELKPVHNMKKEIKKHIEYAKNTNKKNKRVNIRISQKDLEAIQIKALEEGLPYQTLISSLIHKFINGKFTERKA